MRRHRLGSQSKQRIRRMILIWSRWNSKNFSIIVIIFLFIATVLGDPTNLVKNGNFEYQLFAFKRSESSFEVSHNGQMDFIPYFSVVRGAVQVLNTGAYVSNRSETARHGSFILHMNSIKGPGVIQTVPLVTPRKGAPYSFSFSMADNPDGGPLVKAVQVTVLVNNQYSSPSVKQVPYSVSDPYSTRKSLVWNHMSFIFVGTGESTVLQFESVVPGPYGPLIDNIDVSLMTLVENGSFEDFTGNHSGDLRDFVVLKAPSSVITGWEVTEGQIKYAEADRWQPSTDESKNVLDLNAGTKTGTIASTPFKTVPGFKYELLFDATANPDSVPPVSGTIVAQVFSPPTGSLIAYAWVPINGEGFSLDSPGWITYTLDFTATESLSSLEFSSVLPGSFYGPLLDNVNVFQVCDPGPYKKVPRTYSAGTSLKLVESWSVTWAVLIACNVVYLNGL